VTAPVTVPYAEFTIGPQRRSRGIRGARESSIGTPQTNGVLVTLGNDVRLKSREANVQLSGAVELFGPLDFPWVSGSVTAARGTYRVDLGLIKRTFMVDSGSVILEGTPDMPPALDIYTSYTVRRPDSDVKVGAHVYGTTLRPRLNLSSDLGSAVPQSEIISYLVFGRPSFGVNDSQQSASKSVTKSATAAVVPSLGGLLESTLGTLLPFFSTLQVSTVAGEGPENIMANPLDGLLNSVAVTGGRQVGTDTFFSLSGGVCRAGRTSASSNVPFWLGTLVEYRPKRTIGASMAIDPGVAPCSRAGSFGDTYQFGLDLSYDWKFGPSKKP
jgi:translocation and assembly module TamB